MEFKDENIISFEKKINFLQLSVLKNIGHDEAFIINSLLTMAENFFKKRYKLLRLKFLKNKEDKLKNNFLTPVKKLNFYGSISEILNQYGIRYVYELIRYSEKDLLKLSGLGKIGIENIKKRLNEINLNLNFCFLESEIKFLEGFIEKEREKDKRKEDLFLNGDKFIISLSSKLEDIEMPIRTYNVLTKNDIFPMKYIFELVQVSKQDLKRIKGLGGRSIKEIEGFLNEMNLRLGMNLNKDLLEKIFVRIY